MNDFKAFRLHNESGAVQARFDRVTLEHLTPGDVVVRVAYSGVNYKDALAATGKGKIARRFPLVGGIDASGTVYHSTDARFEKGDKVLVCGCGLSETRDGGYADYLRVEADCVIPVPDQLSLHQAMAIGTAGLAAALAVQRMEENGQTPGNGPVLVSGATGGVGSYAIALLNRAGYSVTALTGKETHADYLRTLGANAILPRQALTMGSRPLEPAQWGGAVDVVGGDVLAWLTRTVKPWGNIASVGLAGGMDLHTTVMPFILRGISLLGIHTSACPRAVSLKLWQRLARDLTPQRMDTVANRVIPFDALPTVFETMMQGETTGRIVVKM